MSIHARDKRQIAAQFLWLHGVMDSQTSNYDKADFRNFSPLGRKRRRIPSQGGWFCFDRHFLMTACCRSRCLRQWIVALRRAWRSEAMMIRPWKLGTSSRQSRSSGPKLRKSCNRSVNWSAIPNHPIRRSLSKNRSFLIPWIRWKIHGDNFFLRVMFWKRDSWFRQWKLLFSLNKELNQAWLYFNSSPVREFEENSCASTWTWCFWLFDLCSSTILHLIAPSCPLLLSCQHPHLIHDELYRPSFVTVLMKMHAFFRRCVQYYRWGDSIQNPMM